MTHAHQAAAALKRQRDLNIHYNEGLLTGRGQKHFPAPSGEAEAAEYWRGHNEATAETETISGLADAV